LTDSANLTKSVIKKFLINSINFLEPSIETSNLSCQDLAISLAEVLEQEESVQAASHECNSQLISGITKNSFSCNLILCDIFIRTIQLILKSAIEYSQYEIDQENYFSSKTGNIPLEKYSFFNQIQVKNIYKIFTNSSDSLVSAFLHQNFPQFCVSIAKRIEVLIDLNISQKIKIITTEDREIKSIKSKAEKLDEWLKIIIETERKSYKDLEYYKRIINHIYDVRDCECHIDSIGLSFEEKAHQLYWSVKLKIDKLREDIEVGTLEEVFINFISDYFKTKKTTAYNNEEKKSTKIYSCGGKLIITYYKKNNACYVTLQKIDSRYIIGAKTLQQLKTKLKKIIEDDRVKIRFGCFYRVMSEEFSNDYDNELIENIKKAEDLKKFINQSKYENVIEAFKWVLEKTQYFHNKNTLK
jgi:hypothetical protein